MSKFKVGDRVQRKPEYRNLGSWDCGDSVLVVEAVTDSNSWVTLRGCPGEWAGRRFEKVAPPLLARDELYMRLLNDAKLTHQQALEFIAECPGHAQIRYCLQSQPNTGCSMASLVVWSGKNKGVYREAARRCGWGY